MSVAQPWPPWMHTMNTLKPMAAAKSASSSTMLADLPPSSRKHFFRVSDPSFMMRRPTAVDPVNVIMSTRGSVTSSSPRSLAELVITLKMPGGISVCSTTSLPSAAAPTAWSARP